MNILPSNIFHIKGTQQGSCVVIFGGTHGNETTGVEVINRLYNLFQFKKNSFETESDSVHGDLYFGIGNPLAVEINKRSVSGVRDLNRCFHESFFDDGEEMKLQDQKRAKELCELLESADYFIDLHSVSAKKSVPFIGVTQLTERHKELCSQIPVDFVLNGGSILGEDVGIKGLVQTPTTCSWVNRHNGVGVCYETGTQDDQGSINNAFGVVINILIFLKTLKGDSISNKKIHQQYFDLVYCEKNKFKNFKYSNPRFTESWTPVFKNEIVGSYEDGEEVRTNQDGMLVFPAGESTLDQNQSLFYVAISIRISSTTHT